MSKFKDFINFYDQYPSEQACIDYLEKVRWGERRVCPYCGSGKTYKYYIKELFKCGSCKKQFSVKAGTIFSESKVSLQKWLLVVYLATSLEGGISSLRVCKYLGITQKTAWLMIRKIRYALKDDYSVQ